MAKTRRASSRQVQLQNRVTDLFIETLKEFAPGSTQRLINSSIELMEAQREFLAERIARLEKLRGRVSPTASGGQAAASRRRAASRRVAVTGARRSRAKRASA
jgi:hypothetical protein